MSSVDVPLSVAGIRKLRDNLKGLATALRDEVKVDIERETCMLLAGEVIHNVSSITDLDGNYLGGDNPNSAVSVEPALDDGHEVIWRGEQVAFLEFGTGAPGAADPYPGRAMAAAGYHPDSTKDSWWYIDAKIGPWVSLGLTPQAPMFEAAMLLRTGVIMDPAKIVVKEALNRAIAL
jgi:hypothetical protein